MAAGRPEQALVRLRVQPRASRDEIVAWQDDALRVRVSAPRSRDKVVRVAGLSLAAVRARLAAVVTGLVLLMTLNLDGPWPSIVPPAAADHLTLDPGARRLAPRPLDADVSVRLEDGGFHVGGRLFGFGQSLGAWLRGRLRDGGVTLDGQLHGHRTYNFRLDADGPSITIEIYPGTL